MRLYTYLFYGFYKIIQKTNYKDIAGFMACIWMTAFTITYVIGFLSKTALRVPDHVSSWVYVIVLFMPIMTLNYFCS